MHTHALIYIYIYTYSLLDIIFLHFQTMSCRQCRQCLRNADIPGWMFAPLHCLLGFVYGLCCQRDTEETEDA